MALDAEPHARKTPVQARSRATVDAILTAAAQLLVEKGYDGATTNAVARRAGVSIGSLYQYFPNKEALVSALCHQHMSEMTSMVMGELLELRDQPLPQAIRPLIATLLRAHAREPQLHRLLIELIPRVQGIAAIQRLDKLLIAAIAGELERRSEALRPNDLELAAFIIVHSVQAVTHAAVLDRPDALDQAALADELAMLVMRYLGLA